jgi:hypothetical protein
MTPDLDALRHALDSGDESARGPLADALEESGKLAEAEEVRAGGGRTGHFDVTYTVDQDYLECAKDPMDHVREEIRYRLMNRLARAVDDGRVYVIRWLPEWSKKERDGPFYTDRTVFHRGLLILLANPQDAQIGEMVQDSARIEGFGTIGCFQVVVQVGEKAPCEVRRRQFNRVDFMLSKDGPCILCWKRTA